MNIVVTQLNMGNQNIEWFSITAYHGIGKIAVGHSVHQKLKETPIYASHIFFCNIRYIMTIEVAIVTVCRLVAAGRY